MKVVVTGGSGYIGSHVVLGLLDADHEPIIFDRREINKLTNFPKEVLSEKVDLTDLETTKQLFKTHRPDAVIHMAAFIEAGESVIDPLKYYDNNLKALVNLLQAMKEAGVGRLVFSSTAAVYGIPTNIPILEGSNKQPINAYGQSKKQCEEIIADSCRAYGIKAVALRYFNASGADKHGRSGEFHQPETHLIPLVLEVAAKVRPEIKIFGTDYQTPDGTCVRDYIHVSDLADAHLQSLDYLDKQEEGHFMAINVGTGSGYSVTEIIEAARRITKEDIPAKTEDRRPGDPDSLVASNELAKELLGFTPRYSSLDDIIDTAWSSAKKLHQHQ